MFIIDIFCNAFNKLIYFELQGLFWALACIWLIYDDIKLPHIKGEPYYGNSTYQFIYTNYIPTEFLINGIVSALLTVVNVICIFITAILVLKIKEVASPYTSSPDLRRYVLPISFWFLPMTKISNYTGE